MHNKHIHIIDMANLFGCTVEQVRALYLKNSGQLRSMALKAEATGKRVNGYTAEELNRHADHAKSCAS